MQPKTWIDDEQQRNIFFELADEYMTPMAHNGAKMLPGTHEDNVFEVVGDVRDQLLNRLERHRNEKSSNNTRDSDVWQCDDPCAAAKLIYENFLLRELVGRAVARIRRLRLRAPQSEILDSIPSPPSDNDLGITIEEMLAKSKKVLSATDFEFLEGECNRKLEGGKTVNEDQKASARRRKRWSRIIAKVRSAVIIPLFFAISFTVAMIGNSKSASAPVHQGTVGEVATFNRADHQGTLIGLTWHQGNEVCIVYHQGVGATC